MAGRGPAPKESDRLASRSRKKQRVGELRVVEIEPTEQPPLPENVEWHPLTHDWWAMWGESPLSDDFTDTDWSELMQAAILHTRLWSGNTSVAAELRLRVAKYGATPEDRARLRIQFAAADEADEKRAKPKPSSRQRRGPLTSAG